MRKLLTLLALFIVSLNVCSQEKPFWNEIKAFKTQDSIQKPQDGMLLFIGSSSFRLWKTIKEDFQNENILNRAFGGATLEDLIYWQKEVVLNYKPKKIFIYCGENDIASSETITSEIVFERYKTLHTTLRKQFPLTPIIFVSLKPSISRWGMKDKMMAANNLISNYLKNDKQAVFVNIWDMMLQNGEPRKDIFIQDNLHMNAKGYAIWTKALSSLVKD
nr:GDSL-type esterase/lipase family protein [uncultured Flavobacterium sp.]